LRQRHGKQQLNDSGLIQELCFTNRRFTSYDRSTVTGLDYANNRRYDSQ